MFRRIHQHISGNLVAYIALFLALGGTSYATWMAPANSVNSRAIINGQVTTPDLAANAIRADEHCNSFGCVGSKEIANGAVANTELADASVNSQKIVPGSILADRIAPQAIGTDQLAANGVTGAKVRDGSLTGWDIAAKSIGSAQIDEPSLAQGQAYTAYHDNEIDVAAGETKPILNLALPAGIYFVIGKVRAGISASGGFSCKAYTSSTSDTASAYTGDNGGLTSTLTTTTIAVEPAPFTLHMDCTAPPNTLAGFADAKLTAVSVASNHVTHG